MYIIVKLIALISKTVYNSILISQVLHYPMYRYINTTREATHLLQFLCCSNITSYLIQYQFIYWTGCYQNHCQRKLSDTRNL